MHTVYIGVGSNLGDKLQNLRQGMTALEDCAAVEMVACSLFYKTEPVGYREQDWFINAVLKVRTALAPLPLLKRLKNIEYRNGRRDTSIRFGPRIIDLDILLYDQLLLNMPELTIPHPRMHKRRFVLKPLCDIDPDIVHPGFDLTAKALLRRIEDSDQRLFPVEC